MKYWIGICAAALAIVASSVGSNGRGAVLAAERPVDAKGVILAAAQKCKYKTDGTGNCLSPAFYKCQRDWKKCNDACKSKSNTACLDKCEIIYAAQCGD